MANQTDIKIIEQAIVNGDFYIFHFDNLKMVRVLDRVYLDQSTYKNLNDFFNNYKVFCHTLVSPVVYLNNC